MGSVSTSYHCHQRQEFHYSYTIDKSSREFVVSWYLTTHCNDSHRSPTYYLWSGPARLTVNGTEYSWSTSYSHNGHTVYRGFADNGSYLDNNYRNGVFHDYNGDYIGINRYVKVLGTKWKTGTFRIKANTYGKAKFSVSGKFTWYGETRTFGETFELSSSDLVKQCKVTFKYNNGSFYDASNNKCSNKPSTITCYYGDTINIPSAKPSVTDSNYKFKRWVKKPNGSFDVKSGNVSYTASGKDYVNTSFTTNKTMKVTEDVTLYALWEPANRTVCIEFNSGKYNGASSIKLTGKYGYEITLPSRSQVTNYGKYLSGYISATNGETIAVTERHTPTYRVTSNVTLSAVYTGNYYTINLMDSTGNKLVRQIQNVPFGKAIAGDFRYTPPAGYELIGWSTNPMPVLTPDAAELPYKDNVSPENDSGIYKNTLYIGNQLYTSNPYVPYRYDGEHARTYMFGKDITLYPVLKYLTSFYIYTGTQWQLAVPYIYTGTQWQMALGHIYTGTMWQK